MAGPEDARLALALLVEAYPREQVRPETLAVYARLLAAFERDEIERAAQRAVAEQPRFPAISVLIGYIVEEQLDARAPEWTIAWEQAERWAFGNGPRPSDVVVEAVEALGGTWAIRTSENPAVLRAHFRDFYNERRKRARDELLALPARSAPKALAS